MPVLNVLVYTRTKFFEVPDESSGSQFLCVLELKAQRLLDLVEPMALDKVQ